MIALVLKIQWTNEKFHGHFVKAVYSYGSLPRTVETTTKRNAVRSCNPAIRPQQYARDTRGFELCVQNLVSSSEYDVRSRGRDT